MKNIKDLRIMDKAKVLELDDKALVGEIRTTSRKLFELKMKKNLNELKQTHLIKVLRRYIAMLKTVASSKGLSVN